MASLLHELLSTSVLWHCSLEIVPSTHPIWQHVVTLPLYEEERNKFKEKCASCCEAAAQQSGGRETTGASKTATAVLGGTKKRVTVVNQSTCLHGSPTQSEPRSGGTSWHKCTSTHRASGEGKRREMPDGNPAKRNRCKSYPSCHQPTDQLRSCALFPQSLGDSGI